MKVVNESEYFSLCADNVAHRAATLVIDRADDGDWRTGPGPARNVPDPVRFNYVEKGLLKSMHSSPGGILFRDDLLQFLFSAGVTNIQAFNAVIARRNTEQKWTNYKCIKVLDRITVEEFKTPAAKGILMWLAYESTVIIHKHLRQRFLGSAFDDLRIVKPQFVDHSSSHSI